MIIGVVYREIGKHKFAEDVKEKGESLANQLMLT